MSNKVIELLWKMRRETCADLVKPIPVLDIIYIILHCMLNLYNLWNDRSTFAHFENDVLLPPFSNLWWKSDHHQLALLDPLAFSLNFSSSIGFAYVIILEMPISLISMASLNIKFDTPDTNLLVLALGSETVNIWTI